ncbi:hypothetical protein PYCCODRAFT_1439618 [Trametes coccinea BRFM310]|uniref:Uncharacterized protein n=1 Tax=Trametes coccinea (strain BRFM310) TaxID=1353009 RepID=A0A1Y2IAK0_TRAC3|nr:hypothetical protein PYCCODRAFT_1439618 [Trametes coccinea BRFM310]
MVHRPADSRLLANLLSHEKDYSKHLSILLDYSQASLASFSAFAAACAPPTSQVIVAVAGALAGADDALRSYAAAVERWQEQLKALKEMEDDVGNIMRDREILVTRLIKASKQQKPNRDSVLSGSPSGSSLSVTKPEVHVGQKLSAAQAELQACEAHLAAKEQELNVFRIHTIRSGLQARCKAMVECGWAWGEMGKEGIRALDTLDMANGHGSPLSHPYLHKPLPGHENAGSDISSIAPSQSASQIGHSSGPSTLVESTWRGSSPFTVPTPPKPYTLQIPPAHSIGEFELPNGTIHSTIEEETGGGSSADEDEPAVPVEVHENPRFTKGKPKTKPKPTPSPAPVPPSRHVSFSLRGPKASTSENLLGDPSSLRGGDSPTKKSKTRSGVFGSLAALFHVGGSRNEPEDLLRASPTKAQSRWHTRIDRNLAAARRGDDSDDDAPALSHSYAPRTASPLPFLDSSGQNGGADSHRLKKRATKRGSVQAPPPSRTMNTDKGYSSDTVTESVSKARAKGGRQNAHAKPASEDGVSGSAAKASSPRRGASMSAGPLDPTRARKAPNVAAALLSEGGTSLSRNSSVSKQSIASAATAPPRTPAHASSPSPLGRQGSTSRKRTASLNVSPSSSNGTPSTPSKHKRTVSTSGTPTPPRNTLTNGEASLMSIVEGISRFNKQSALAQDPSRLLVVPKAPGPVNVSVSDSDFSMVRVASKQHSPESSSPSPRPRLKKEGQSEATNYRNSLLMSASVSAPSLPIETASQPKPLPAKMPLRSALRNASRSPSPTKVPLSPEAPAVPNGKPIVASPEPPATIPRSVTASTITPATMAKRRESDVSSISSYETGREELDDEVPPPESAQPPLPPPHEDAHDTAGGSELSNNSTASTASTASPPVRRKSVRMSLPPTFSTTPPAIEDTDEDEDGAGTPGKRRHEPWSSRGGPPTPRPEAAPPMWGSRIERNGTRDVWAADSSDESEDAEYSAAKRLLSRLSRKQEH